MIGRKVARWVSDCEMDPGYIEQHSQGYSVFASLV